MSILEKIKSDQLAARKSRNKIATNLLTTLIGEVSTISEQDYKTGKTEITDEKVIATIRKFIKNAKETKDALAARGTFSSDAAQEMSILETYLPEQLSENALKEVIEAFKNNNAGSNVGSIMAYLKANYAGLYDAKAASILAKG